MFLTLPRLSPRVPTSYVFGGLSERLVRLAHTMTETGMIEPDDVALIKGPLSALPLRELVEKCWHREFGDRLSFSALSTGASLILSESGNGYYEPENDDAKTLEVAFYAAHPDVVFAEKVMTTLEKHRTGLGRYAMSVLDDGLAIFGVPMTPMGALSMAQLLYWMGEDDESVVIEEYQSEGSDTSDIVTRSQLFDGLPAWVFDYGQKEIPMLDAAQVEAEIQQLADPVLARMLPDLIALEAEIKRARQEELLPQGSDEGYESFEFMSIVRWNEDDQLARVFDDYYNYLAQGETYYCLGHIRFPATADGLKEAKTRMDATLAILNRVDRILEILRNY